MNDKVEIEITEGGIFTGGDNKGKPFTSVSFMTKRYGGSSPCITNEEIQSAIKNKKEWIIKEGGKPIVKDLRKKATLLAYI